MDFSNLNIRICYFVLMVSREEGKSFNKPNILSLPYMIMCLSVTCIYIFSVLMLILRSPFTLVIPRVVWLVVAVVVIVHGFHRRNIINGEVSKYLDKLVLWTMVSGLCG